MKKHTKTRKKEYKSKNDSNYFHLVLLLML